MDALDRLSTLVLSADMGLDPVAVDRQIRRAIDWVVQVERLPMLLDRLAREIRGGGSLSQALAAVAKDDALAGSALREAMIRAEHGISVVDALDGWAEALNHRDAAVVRAVLATGHTAGGGLASALTRAAISFRDRAAAEREVRALSAQSRASAMVLTAAPGMFLVLFGSLNPAVLATATGLGLGRVCLLGGALLDVAGWRWMMVLERRVLR